MAEKKVKLVAVSAAAKQLNVQPQLLYNFIKSGKLESPGRAGKAKGVVFEDAKKVVATHRENVAKGGGRHLSWDVLTDFLKNSNMDTVRFDIDALREMVGAPHARLEMLHYWDPYRALFDKQGTGFKAIEAAGYEITSIDLGYSDFIKAKGAIAIHVARKEQR